MTPPNKSLQGPVIYKVLGRGWPGLMLHSPLRARVLMRTRAAHELNRLPP